jgi:hypothetical protein
MLSAFRLSGATVYNPHLVSCLDHYSISDVLSVICTIIIIIEDNDTTCNFRGKFQVLFI